MKYIAGFILTIILIIFAFVLIFRGGDEESVPTDRNLLKYANSSTVMQYTIKGPVQALENHHEIRISVAADQRMVEVLQGYDGRVVQRKTFGNDQAAYSEFLRALQVANFTRGSDNVNLRDERGICPTGNRYIYEIIESGQTTQRYWSTSCSQSQGTFLGQKPLVRTLFKQQIPEYDRITGKYRL